MSETQTTGEKQGFEIGQFYSVQPSIWSSSKIPMLCVKKTKCKIWFEFLCKDPSGSIYKQVITRRLDGDCAYCPDKWTTIQNSRAEELSRKPKMWDEIPEAELPKRK